VRSGGCPAEDAFLAGRAAGSSGLWPPGHAGQAARVPLPDHSSQTRDKRKALPLMTTLRWNRHVFPDGVMMPRERTTVAFFDGGPEPARPSRRGWQNTAARSCQRELRAIGSSRSALSTPLTHTANQAGTHAKLLARERWKDPSR